MTRRVRARGAGHVVLAALLLVTQPWSLGGSIAAAAGCAAAFGLVGLVPMHLELRRHACTVVMTEAVLVIALVQLGPLGVVAAATAGEAIACLTSRQSGLKLAFNVAAAMGASAVAASVAIAAGIVPAVAAFALVSLLATSAVLAVAERRRVRDVLVASASTALVSSAVSASVGMSALALGHVHAGGPVLLAPLLAVVFLGTRRMAQQSAEHLRFERLYEASARTGGLAGLDEALKTLAAEARGLVTGSAAVCLARRPDGDWVGALVDDDGAGPAAPELVRGLLALPGDQPRSAAAEAAALLPGAADLVWVPPRAGVKGSAALAVFREIAQDDQAAARVEVLAAFAGHAALTVANALLYQEVEEALVRQIDLTRQKADFLATVSHELRTPLTCVLGAVSTIRRCRDRLAPADVERMLQTALDQGDRLKRLIEDLLLVASAEHGDMRADLRPVDLGGLVSAVVADMGPTAGGRLHARVDPACDGVVSDEHKLRQLVTNLLENALKYAPAGSIEVTAARVGQVVDLAVVDHGPGIPAEDRERVFERFVQLDQSSTRRRGGTGLGLYLCRQLAGLLGGSLTLEATPGGGSTFRLRVPWRLAGDHAAEPVAAHPNVLRPPAGRAHHREVSHA